MIGRLPNKKAIARGILRHAASEEQVKKIARAVADEFYIDDFDRWSCKVLTLDERGFDYGRREPFFRRFRSATNSLIDEKLLDRPGPGRLKITERGRAVLAAWKAAG
jgi:hypothetical protein